jgi:hypothetical protein
MVGVHELPEGRFLALRLVNNHKVRRIFRAMPHGGNGPKTVNVCSFFYQDILDL